MASQQIWASLRFGTAILLVCSFRVVGQETQPRGSGNVKASVEKTDAKALLRAARAALERGDLDRAESLTAEAEKAPPPLATWKRWWSDSPPKLWRDIQAARARESAKLLKRIEKQEMIAASKHPASTRTIVAGDKKAREDWPAFRPAVAARPAGTNPPLLEITRGRVSTPRTSRDIAEFQDKFLGRPASAEPPLLEIAGGPVSTIPTPRDLAVFREKLLALEGKNQALLLLAEASKAIVAGNPASAREYTLQAKNLRPSSSWDQKDLLQLRAYLQRQAIAGPGRAAEKKDSPLLSSSQASPIDKKPAVKDSGVDLPNQVTTDEQRAPSPESADEDEGEPAAEPKIKTIHGSAGKWFVVAGVAAILLLGVALRKLYLAQSSKQA